MSNTPFLPQTVIMTKRDKGVISDSDMRRFVAGISDGSVSDGQIAALAMAVFLNGMSAEEGASLTLAMRDSGDVLNWAHYGLGEGPIVDKHSTGGVGDKVSLMLAPIVAAAGGLVPMISGRGLGHTGGTLDKLEAIPGYDPYPSIDRFAEITKSIGCSIIGQTGALAPADKRFYATRDVTGTVESIPLITASILSKKLAAGLKALVMDVKFGSGAFMETREKARALAENIVRVAGAAGTPVTALLTDMNEILGPTAGNSVETQEAIDFLKDPASADARLKEITLALAAHMLHAVGVVETAEDGLARSKQVLENGEAAEVFARMVVAHGGPADLMENGPKHMPLAPVVRDVAAGGNGFVGAIDTRRIGMAVVALGGGRTEPSQKIDHSVGLGQILGLGRSVEADTPLARIYAQDEAAADYAEQEVRQSFKLSDTAPEIGPNVAEVIGAQ